MKAIIKVVFAILIALALNGCTFIIKDDHTAKYYGIDERRGSEYLNQILDQQQQTYESAKAPLGTKKP
jgi:uncharacterized protein YceK